MIFFKSEASNSLDAVYKWNNERLLEIYCDLTRL
jgi:hypothetical protein